MPWHVKNKPEPDQLPLTGLEGQPNRFDGTSPESNAGSKAPTQTGISTGGSKQSARGDERRTIVAGSRADAEQAALTLFGLQPPQPDSDNGH